MIDQTCNAGTKFENVQLITKEMQYLYNDGATFYFMDNETYEQVELPADFIGDNAKWFKENDNAQLLYADTELLGVQPRCSSRSRSPRPTPASRATPSRAAPSRPRWRPVP